jgi:6-bladed beta-propeller
MKTQLLLLVLLVLLLQGCKTGNNETVIQKVFDINTENFSEGSLEDYFTLDKIIPLDTCKGAYLNSGFAASIIFLQNKMIVNDYSPAIKVFDKETGKLYKIINRAGRGPEEYAENIRFVLKNGEYFVARAYNKDLMFYDIDGNFIKKDQRYRDVKMNNANDLDYLPDGNSLLYKGLVGLYNHKDSKLPYYSTQLVDKDGKILKEMLEIPSTMPVVVIMSSWPSFSKYKDEMYLTAVNENKIFKYNYADSLFIPLYTLNIDNIDFYGKLAVARDSKSLLSFMKETYNIRIVSITDRYLVVSSSSQGLEKSICLVIDKKTGDYKLFDAKQKSGIGCGHMLNNSEGLLINLVSYTDLLDKEGNLLDIPLVKQIQKVTPLHENMNAVLCFYNEK